MEKVRQEYGGDGRQRGGYGVSEDVLLLFCFVVSCASFNNMVGTVNGRKTRKSWKLQETSDQEAGEGTRMTSNKINNIKRKHDREMFSGVLKNCWSVRRAQGG